MAQQVKKKFIGNDQVDGSKILLEQSQSIRAKDSSNQEVDLISLGGSDEVLVKGQEVGLKSDIDAEQARAEAAEGVLQGNIDSEEASRIAGDQALQGEIDAAEGRLDTAEGEIDTLQSEMDAVEGRLDIIEGPDSQVGSISKALKDAKDYTDAEIAALVDSAPELLDTLNELAAALGDDPNFATTVTNLVAGVQSAVDAVEDDVSNLVTLSGMPVDSQNLGEFTGSILDDNTETVKSAIQKLSDEIESIGGGGSSTQTELDNTQEGAGLNTDGSYIAPINSNYLNGTLSLAGADMMLDTQIKVNEDAIAQEVIDRAADVDAEETRALAAEGVLQSNIDTVSSNLAQEILDREADVDAEEARAIAAEGVLQSNIDDVASDLALHISQEIGAHEASAISVVAISDVVGSDVQAVLEDLKSQIDNHLNDTEDAHSASAISVSPSGNLSSSDTQAALEELQGDIDAINQELDGLSFSAEAISFSPAGNIEAVDVQAAIEELDSEKVAKSGDSMQGQLTMEAANVVVDYSDGDIIDQVLVGQGEVTVQYSDSASGSSSSAQMFSGSIELSSEEPTNQDATLTVTTSSGELIVASKTDYNNSISGSLSIDITGASFDYVDNGNGDSYEGTFAPHQFSAYKTDGSTGEVRFINANVTSGTIEVYSDTGSGPQAIIPTLDYQLAPKKYVDDQNALQDTALSNHINDEEDAHDASAISFSNTASGLTASNVQDAIDEVESRVQTLEEALTPVWERVKFDLTSTDISNGYVDLSHEAIANSISAFVDRLAIHEGEDFIVSVEGGVTRITFSGDLVPPSGQSQLDDSDNIYVRYQRLA